MQRLFSNFANGWPGLGLLIQRVITAIILTHGAVAHIGSVSKSNVLAEFAGAGLGIFVLVGLWTPVAGVLVAVVELWVAYLNAGDPWISIVLAALGATLAMIGPGAWSIDARLFGRKHFTS